jgi:hypothetical protein
MYVLVVVLEAGIFISHISWRIRYRELRKEAKDSGRSIDDLLMLRRNETQVTEDLEKGILPASPVGVEGRRQIERKPTPDAKLDDLTEKC